MGNFPTTGTILVFVFSHHWDENNLIGLTLASGLLKGPIGARLATGDFFFLPFLTASG